MNAARFLGVFAATAASVGFFSLVAPLLTAAIGDDLGPPVAVNIAVARSDGAPGQCDVHVAEEAVWTAPDASDYGLTPVVGVRVLRVPCTAIASVISHASACLLRSWRPAAFPDPLAASPCGAP